MYWVIVVPYKRIQARRGHPVFGEPAPTKTCPACLSSDLPAAASKCKYCGTDQPLAAPDRRPDQPRPDVSLTRPSLTWPDLAP